MDQNLNKMDDIDLPFTETMPWKMTILEGSVRNHCCSYKTSGIFDTFLYVFDTALYNYNIMELIQRIWSYYTSFSGYLQSTMRNIKILTKGNPSTVNVWRVYCTNVRDNSFPNYESQTMYPFITTHSEQIYSIDQSMYHSIESITSKWWSVTSSWTWSKVSGRCECEFLANIDNLH